jgi:hypothetical protein
MAKIYAADIALIRAAASLAAHAPERMHAAHLAPRLEALARRLSGEMEKEPEIPGTPLLRAA